MKRTLLVLTVAVGALTVPVSAHHSFNRFYFEDQSVSITGEVVEFQYRNPHTWLYVMVEEESGEMVRYGAEWSNPRGLGRSGITADTLQPGDVVVLTGSPGRDASEHTLHLKGIERPADGFQWEGRRGQGRRRGRR
jgi:hypothetical protein